MNGILGCIWNLLRLCAAHPRGRIGIVYLVVVLLLNIGTVLVGLRMIEWSADFYNALQKLETDEILRQVGVFVLFTAISSLLYLAAAYTRKLLQIRWRCVLTDAALDAWMTDKAYWHAGESGQPMLDNPDQRIAEDCRIFVVRVTEEAVEMISALIALVSYATVLWKLSAFPLSFTLFGIAVEIPHYMVWAAPIYVLIASSATHFLGAPLARINIVQQRREADFRFALSRFRKAGEAVALADGERAERRIMDERFRHIVANWRELIGRELILGCFTRPYRATILRVPMFLALPAFLAQQVTLGGLMQLAAAFSNVVTNLSWFIFSYGQLAELAATSVRLDAFLKRMKETADRTQPVVRRSSPDGTLRIRNLEVDDPAGNRLVHIPHLDILPGESVWIRGASGIGKSTFLKSVAGLWAHCRGIVEVPEARHFHMSQQVYLPLGPLAAAVAYPDTAYDQASVERLLNSVGLASRPETGMNREIADKGDDVEFRFSGGELQRLAIARILAARPDWIFLDETTNALDDTAEEELLSLLRRELPSATFVVVSHREPKGLGLLRPVDLESSFRPLQNHFDGMAVNRPASREDPYDREGSLVSA